MTRSITQLYIDWNASALKKLAHTKALLQAELGIETAATAMETGQ